MLLILPSLMVDGRDVATNPLCGDVWQLADGRHFVVDLSDGLRFGFTCSDGYEGAFNYTAGMAKWLQARGARYVGRHPFPWCDDHGLTRIEDGRYVDRFTVEDVLAWLATVLKKP